MQLDKVSVKYGRKVNLGNFESANIEVSLWADLDEDDDEAEIMIQLWEMAKANVKAQIAPLAQGRINLDVEEIFLGLPKSVRSTIAEDLTIEADSEAHNVPPE